MVPDIADDAGRAGAVGAGGAGDGVCALRVLTAGEVEAGVGTVCGGG